MSDKFEFLIVGSGAGGAMLAKELAQRGRRVLIIERGDAKNKLGSPLHALRYYDLRGISRGPFTSKEGVVLWRTFMAGGTTVIACGNAVRCLQKPLLELGIRLDDEFAEVDKELGVGVPDASVVCDSSRRILEASKALGYRMELMPKLIDFKKCDRCGQCLLGCARGAKWSAMTPLEEAQRHGAEVLYGTRVLQVRERGYLYT
jgi:choline dehydrogenase-like flavoprotein